MCIYIYIRRVCPQFCREYELVLAAYILTHWDAHPRIAIRFFFEAIPIIYGCWLTIFIIFPFLVLKLLLDIYNDHFFLSFNPYKMEPHSQIRWIQLVGTVGLELQQLEFMDVYGIYISLSIVYIYI